MTFESGIMILRERWPMVSDPKDSSGSRSTLASDYHYSEYCLQAENLPEAGRSCSDLDGLSPDVRMEYNGCFGMLFRQYPPLLKARLEEWAKN